MSQYVVNPIQNVNYNNSQNPDHPHRQLLIPYKMWITTICNAQKVDRSKLLIPYKMWITTILPDGKVNPIGC